MILIVLGCGLLSVTAWLLLRWRIVKSYWAKRNVPHNPPHPIVGSLDFLFKENAVFWMRKIYNEFKSPYVGVWLFWRPALIINCPELARRVLVKDADNFKNKLISSGRTDPIGQLNLFTVNDPLWTSLRRRLNVIFTGAKLRSVHNIYSDKAKDLVTRIESDIRQKKLINLRSLFSDYTTDVFGDSAFGVSSTATITGDSPLRRVTSDFTKFSMFRGLSWTSIFFMPELVDYFGFSFFPKSTITYLRKVFRSVVQQREQNKMDHGEIRDMLDVLLKMKQEAKIDGEEISEDLLLAQAAIFLQGGFDTSAVNLTFTIYELAHQPLIQEKLYAELFEAQQKANGELDSTILAELSYLNAVLEETLRKYPPLGFLDRIALKDYKIDDNLIIPAGTPIYVNAAGLQMDPNLFPEPEKFIPERFLPEHNSVKPYTHMPFGEGPRHCIGKRFAYQTLRYGLSKVLLSFEVRPLPNSPLPNDCHIDARSMLMMPDEVMSVEFINRKAKTA
ncbi:hypothetical protein O3G_MSEX008748 [Manduca sexta]|uniref:unspecific monooxygenase n=1 Tax=Manduca sexta TaxID=7130 RepID=A0A922CQH4_MANSE|nr:hypothetical protein O3G_MSEX008748 [Manduca sexta]KAG6454550.1 hypothetical protein O3G_MSEX008748 [Manduca sexta]